MVKIVLSAVSGLAKLVGATARTAAVALVLTPAGISGAATLSSSYNSNVTYSYPGLGTVNDVGSDSTNTNASLTRTSQLQAEFSLFVQSDFGVNKIEITTARYGPGVVASGATANSFWDDTFVVSGGVGTGTATFQERIHGDLQLSALSSSPFASIRLIVRIPIAAQGISYSESIGRQVSHSWSGTSFVNGILTRDFQFTYGIPFTIQSELSASVQDGGIAHFGSTILAGLILPAGATVVSESGKLYSELAPIPEPRTYLLLLAGLGLISYVTRHRKGI